MDNKMLGIIAAVIVALALAWYFVPLSGAPPTTAPTPAKEKPK